MLPFTMMAYGEKGTQRIYFDFVDKTKLVAFLAYCEE